MSKSNNGSGIDFVGLLAIAFIVLKLTEVIDWSWIWVLSPLWVAGIIGGLSIITLLILDKKGV